MVVADAAPGVGLGHLSRAGAVAAALQARGAQVHAFANSSRVPLDRFGIDWRPAPDPAELGDQASRYDAVFADSYTLPDDTIEELARKAPLCIARDSGEPHSVASLILEPAGSDSARLPGGARMLRGLRYACLRPPYWGLPTRRQRREVRRILVSAGGGDTRGAAAAMMAAARAAAPVAELVPIGPAGHGPFEAPADLASPLLDVDIALCGAGQTSLEACAAGTPCVAVVLTENQRPNATALTSGGASLTAELSDHAALVAAVSTLAAGYATRTRLGQNAQREVDGYGAFRVAFEIERLIGEA